MCDLGRKWVELDVIRYNIARSSLGSVFLCHVKVLKYDFSDDLLLLRCQGEARRRSDGRWGIHLCVYILADRAQSAQRSKRCSNSQKA